jgi:ectoine hydroxylase-related dioxygenase (phytanoyl-CoA dioxygenase family)
MDIAWKTTLDQNGFAIVPDALPAEECDHWVKSIAHLTPSEPKERRGGERNLFQRSEEIRRLARLPAIRSCVEEVLGTECFAVRALFFDKTEEANWAVPWHQDVTIAVKERREIPGYGPWSVKCGIPHVQPPTEVLERMLAVRIHLDACGEDKGPLRVLSGSHLFGVFPPGTIGTWLPRFTPQICPVSRGGLLLMRPLLLHASSSATQPGHRRVIHLEYASGELAKGLEWFERW